MVEIDDPTNQLTQLYLIFPRTQSMKWKPFSAWIRGFLFPFLKLWLFCQNERSLTTRQLGIETPPYWLSTYCKASGNPWLPKNLRWNSRFKSRITQNRNVLKHNTVASLQVPQVWGQHGGQIPTERKNCVRERYFFAKKVVFIQLRRGNENQVLH